MRTAQDSTGHHSATPIYDALYSEYLRAFRALPGDRSGEEDLGFTAFAQGPYGAQHRSDGRHDSRYSPFHMARHGQYEHHGTSHYQVPAALPPGPRRER